LAAGIAGLQAVEACAVHMGIEQTAADGGIEIAAAHTLACAAARWHLAAPCCHLQRVVVQPQKRLAGSCCNRNQHLAGLHQLHTVAGVRTLADSQQSLHEVAHCMQPAVDVPSCCTDPVLARIAVVDIAVGSLHMDIAVGMHIHASVRTVEGRTAADELAASSAAAAAAAAAAVDSLVDFWMPR